MVWNWIDFWGGVTVGLIFGVLIGWFTAPQDPTPETKYKRRYREAHGKIDDIYCDCRHEKGGVYYCEIEKGKKTIIRKIGDDLESVLRLCRACKQLEAAQLDEVKRRLAY